MRDYPFPLPGGLRVPPEWDEVRRACPVAPLRLPSGDAALLLSRYADVRQVLSAPRFTRTLEGDGRITEQESGGVCGAGAPATTVAGGEAHQQWRRLVNRSFTVKR